MKKSYLLPLDYIIMMDIERSGKISGRGKPHWKTSSNSYKGSLIRIGGRRCSCWG